jgi:hypothetical protein
MLVPLRRREETSSTGNADSLVVLSDISEHEFKSLAMATDRVLIVMVG